MKQPNEVRPDDWNWAMTVDKPIGGVRRLIE